MKHLPLIVAVALSGAVGVSCVYWGTQLSRPEARPVAAAPHAEPALPDIMAAAGLFGGTPSVAATTVFKLKGVIEDGADSVAILVEDGKPAQAVGIGQQPAPGVTVTEIHQRYVMLDMSGKPTRLDLPDGGSGGLELVAAAPAAPVPSAVPATPAVPAVSFAAATPAVPAGAPSHVASTGTVPAAAQSPAAGPPGLSDDQRRQLYEERRRQEMQQNERARRAAGMAAPPPSGPAPTT